MIITTVTPMLSIRPDRISITQMVRKTKMFQFFENSGVLVTPATGAGKPATPSARETPTIKKKFHNFSISKNSQKNLRDKILYLFQFAKSRSIKTYSGKTLPNFKVCFLTLTLPSTQMHATSVINEKCLDEFLQVLRKRLKMQNYVWRLEHQANGNVHYHICTDVYIDYFFALKHWNNIIEKLGYISAFSEKMLNISYKDYVDRFSKGGTISPAVLYKRYLKGRSEKWRNPNTVDVKNAKNSDNISFYISKYFSKKEKTAKCNSLDNEENSFAIRLCFWSRSLSRCKAETMPFDYFDYDFERIFSNMENVRVMFFDYCKVLYYSFNKLPAVGRSLIGAYFSAMRKEISYAPAL